jgi:hypothetical protein
MLVKSAFDTRRINQDTEFNPRRNLQYYQRSEPFIDDATARQVGLFLKLKAATDELREHFIGEPDWLDSYTRVLSNAVDQTLRVDQKDFDYSKPQLDYLSELLYVRYRLQPQDIETASKDVLKSLILNKDEKLAKRSIFINYKQDFNKASNNQLGNFYNNAAVIDTSKPVKQEDGLLEKLFGNVKASQENKEVERSVSIIIRDKIVDSPIVKDADESKNTDVIKEAEGEVNQNRGQA